MKVSYNWLKDYVDFDLDPRELAEKLTMAGIEVEEIIENLPFFEGVEVARVLNVRKHPNADKLSLCDVQTKEGVTEVICGAPNVAAGQNIPFAGIGTVLPNGVKIKKAKIRGVESVGMICSEAELGLAGHSDGIWELPEDWEIGLDVYKKLAADKDYVLDLSITPNRPDAMSMIGIARDVAAIAKTQYRYPEIQLNETSDKAQDMVRVDIDCPDGCPRYSARIIKDVKIQASPEWLAKRLQAAGIRPINNIVDITNYVLMELGQPLHAFDLARISGNRINVRYSHPGENFITLDEKERSLPENTVMICDAEKTVAIGGIMGGLNSEVSDETADILLESAYFSPARIGASSKRLGLSSEASQRFERGIDPNGVIRAADRAAALMVELAGGKLLRGIVDEYPTKIDAKKVKVRPARINMLLGTDLPESEIKSIFSRLEVLYENQICKVPTFRPDLEREVDLIEEIARMISFDAIPLREATAVEYDAPRNKNDQFTDFLKSQLRELGLTEVITNSMMSARDTLEVSNLPTVKIMNPISDDMQYMRTSLIPGLLKVTAYNINRNIPDLRIFEIGRVFFASHEIDEKFQPYKVSGITHGRRWLANWDVDSLTVDFYDLKGLIESFSDKICLDNLDFILYDNNVYFDADQVVGISADGDKIGHFGKINQAVCARYDIKTPVYGFEFGLPELQKNSDQNRLFNAFSKYPFIEKDVAFIVDRNISAGNLKKTISDTGGPLVISVDIFDLYQGDKLGNDKKSVAFRIRFQSQERTLNDKEVNALFEKIIGFIQHKFHATLRDE